MTIVTKPKGAYTIHTADTEPRGAYTIHTAGYNIGDKVYTADTVNTVDT